MPDFPTFPDIEAAISQLLRDAGARAYSSVPASPIYPLAVVERSGGTPAVRQYLDAARIDVSVYGENKGQAHDLAQSHRATIHSAEGSVVTTDIENVWISGVEDVLGLTYLPDPDTGRDRYLFSVRVYARRMGDATS